MILLLLLKRKTSDKVKTIFINIFLFIIIGKSGGFKGLMEGSGGVRRVWRGFDGGLMGGLMWGFDSGSWKVWWGVREGFEGVWSGVREGFKDDWGHSESTACSSVWFPDVSFSGTEGKKDWASAAAAAAARVWACQHYYRRKTLANTRT